MEKTRIGKLTFAEIDSSKVLDKVFDKEPEQIILEILESELRGRGGAGFPTGMKWKMAHEAVDDARYVVCNADEGEPGTFKDRVILSEFTDLLLDGMTIAGYVLKASKGFIYLRGEYTYLVEQLEKVLSERRKMGKLSPEYFDIEIRMGAGAYICGEESALIESMEGKRGEPRDRPPYPTESGYLSRPTIIDNVETFAWVAAIMAKGAGWFNSMGTEKSKGLKIYSVSGDCKYPGVYEFPYGTTLKELLKKVKAVNTKAVQVGGASGYCIPAKDFNRKLAFEDVSTSGSVIVFDKNRDMLDIAENFLEFFEDESCGQCTPCREGVPKLLEGVRLLKNGECTVAYLDELMNLADTMAISSKCGLGQSAPNSFKSIITNFKNEILGRVRS